MPTNTALLTTAEYMEMIAIDPVKTKAFLLGMQSGYNLGALSQQEGKPSEEQKEAG